MATDAAEARTTEIEQLEDVGALREEAARFAAMACARAMRRSLAHCPRLIERFVDDALRACGRPRRAIVKLNPRDALNVTAREGAKIVADDGIEEGAVIVKTSGGTLGASIEERALGLARMAADHA